MESFAAFKENAQTTSFLGRLFGYKAAGKTEEQPTELDLEQQRPQSTKDTSNQPPRIDDQEQQQNTDSESSAADEAIESATERHGGPLAKLLARVRREREDQAFWIKDAAANQCYQCQLHFNLFRRRHHCRVCGQVFCNDCTQLYELGHGYDGAVGGGPLTRVCNYDLDLVKRYEVDNDAASDHRRRSTIHKMRDDPETQQTVSSQQMSISLKRMFGQQQSIFSSKFWQPPEGVDATTSTDQLPFRNAQDENDLTTSGDNSAVMDMASDGGDEQQPFDSMSTLQPGRKNINKYSAVMMRNQLSFVTTLPTIESADDAAAASPLAGSRRNSFIGDQTVAEVDILERDQQALDHLRQILRQLLAQYQVNDPIVWESQLLNISVTVTRQLRMRVKKEDDNIDIRQYIHIKLAQGDVQQAISIVPGVVATKNVLHKSMQRQIKNARIILIGFPLEYSRQDHQYLSLEPILKQEHEHLRNLVNRVASKTPDAVLCSRAVSRVALEFLVAAGLVVASNVKDSVMHRVARATGAEIVKTMDRLAVRANTRVGQCGQFYIKTFCNGSTRKSLMFFDDCQNHRNSTILVRGPVLEELSKIKAILKFIVGAANSVRLESHYMQDSFSQRQCFTRQADIETFGSSLLGKLLLPYYKIVLSNSPTVCISPPYLLMQMARFEQNIHTIAVDAERIEHAKIAQQLQLAYDSLVDDLKQGNIAGHQVDSELPTDVRRGLEYLVDNSKVILSPLSHQNLVVLYCNVNILTSVPCHQPALHTIEYYQDSDMALGQFLEELCFDSNYVCQNEQCQQPMLKHFRSYVHGKARVNVIIENFPAPIAGMQDTILSWTFCKLCAKVTPCSQLSDEAWRFSFGKFLELIFYDRATQQRSEICTHGFFENHIQYFGLHDVAVRFEYEYVVLSEVVIPRKTFFVADADMLELRNREFRALTSGIDAFYESLQSCLSALLQKTPLIEPQDYARELDSLIKKVAQSKSAIMVMQQAVQRDQMQLGVYSANSVMYELHKDCLQWDANIAALARKYLISEKSDKRIASTYLKRIVGSGESTSMPNVGPVAFNPDFVQAVVAASDNSQNQDGASVVSNVAPNQAFDDTPSIAHGDHAMRASSHSRYSRANTEVSVEARETVTLNSQDAQLQIFVNAQDSPNSQLREVIAPSDVVGIQQSSAENIPELIKSLQSDTEVKTGFMRTLKDMWQVAQKVYGSNNGRRALAGLEVSMVYELANIQPLKYPFGYLQHYMENAFVIREDEPASIIAYALSSKHYKDEIKRIRSQAENPVVHVDEASIRSSVVTSRPLANALGIDQIDLERTPSFSTERSQEQPQIEAVTMRHPQNQSVSETLLTHTSGTHIRYQFAAGDTKCFCRVYFAEQFDAIRQFCKVEQDGFIESMMRCVAWKSVGGKSGSLFYKSLDDRWIIKSFSKSEFEAFLSFAPQYFEYMAQIFFHNLPSVLVKLFGVYRIGFKNATSGAQLKTDVVVIENLFYKRNMSQIFDLKGSMRNRHAQATGRDDEVLFDENLMEIMAKSPLFLREHSKKLLRASVWNDTLFLSKLNVMDYSLLVGVDADSNEFVVGVVDFIRTFSWDKKLESWVKESGILGGNGREPTIISPRQYKTRFREAMERYFLLVPDKFTHFEDSKPVIDAAKPSDAASPATQKQT